MLADWITLAVEWLPVVVLLPLPVVWLVILFGAPD